MIFRFSYLLFHLILFSSILSSDLVEFKDLPIQEEGRIKPLDTFARNQLLRFYGKRSITDEILPTDWLYGILVEDSKNTNLPIFNIRSPEVAHSLGLEWSKEHKYAFSQLIPLIESKIEMFKEIYSKSEEEYSLAEKQLMEIYFNVYTFKNIHSSLSCLTPTILVDNPIIAEAIDVEIGQTVSYFRFIQNIDNMNILVRAYLDKDHSSLVSSDSSFFKILDKLNNIYTNRSNGFNIIPVSPNIDDQRWLSPWELMDGRKIDKFQSDLLLQLERYINQRDINNTESKNAISEYSKILYSNLISLPHPSILKKESWYNKTNLFYKSTAFYLLSFILILFSFLFRLKILSNLATLSLGLGFLSHLYGLYLRMLIMGRPPVSTLYESIIFVGFISVLSGILIEIFKKDSLGILIASISGSIFHYVSFGYAADGDTLGMLVAVLNSNFWLATHVTTMTIGYGVSIIAGIMGHLYLFCSIILPDDNKRIREIYDNTFAVTLLALFFTVFGTILGGIWADQSWGRFWGWDPKENGALLICMWQIFMIHMRLTGMVKGPGFSLGMIFNIIIVTIAWFGVNLLGIGLHSYGFASGIAFNLTVFIIFELCLGCFTYYLCKKKQQKINK